MRKILLKQKLNNLKKLSKRELFKRILEKEAELSVFFLIFFVMCFTLVRPNLIDLVIASTLESPGVSSAVENYTFTDYSKVSDYADFNNSAVLGATIKKSSFLEVEVLSSDARVKALEEYFASKKSPLFDQASLFVSKADKYNFAKWNLLPAIATVETSSCMSENFAPFKLKNCWGWRLNGKTVIFNTWDDAIDNLTRNLSNWNTNPYYMQRTYCPPCEASGDNHWANGVVSEMNKIGNIAKVYGVTPPNTK
ncbi:MAG: hypothetical protein WCO33_02085 [bacterium]